MSTSEVQERAFTEQHRERLRPILAQLDAGGGSVFLDLCELTLMLSESIGGTLKFDHPRVTVHIKRRRKA